MKDGVADTNEADKKVEEEGSGEESEGHDIIFKVKLEKPEPNGVKISKKNICLVNILGSGDAVQERDEAQKLFEYFMS